MIKMRFISIVVKIAALDKIYNGGFEQFRKDYITKIEAAEKDGRLDKDLLCFSVMNPMDTSDIVSMFEEIGLIPTEVIDGEKCWKDLCIIEVPFGLTKRCDWIMYYGPIAAYVDKKENRERVKQEVFEYYEFKKRQNTLKELEREIEKQKVKDDVQIEGNFNIREVFLSWDEKSEVFPEKIYDALFTSKNLDIHSLRMAYHNLCKIKDNAEYYTFLGIIYYNISNDKIKEISWGTSKTLC